MIINSNIYQPSQTGHRVRFYDWNGTLLKTQYVKTGNNAVAPTPPTHSNLTFQEWNNPLTNITMDWDIGAIYKTTDNKTYLYATFTVITGLQPPILLTKTNTNTLTIDWGDGTSQIDTGNGARTITKTNPYVSYGSYIITITYDSSYSLSNYIMGTGTYLGAVTKAHISNYVNALNYTFRNSSLRECTIPLSVTNLGTNTFYATPLKNINFPSGITTLMTNTLYACHTKFILSKNTVNIDSLSIWGNMQDFINLSNASSISESVGRDGHGLESVILPNNMDTIKSNSFNYSYLLQKIKLPNNLITIEANSFSWIYKLDELDFPNTLTTIGTGCFTNILDLKMMIFRTITPPSLASGCFTNMKKDFRIYVPDASVNDYKIATNWINVANYIYPLSQYPN